jgi:hypothetical protein
MLFYPKGILDEEAMALQSCWLPSINFVDFQHTVHLRVKGVTYYLYKIISSYKTIK